MKHPENVVIRRSDYRAPGFLVDRVELCFELDPLATRVESRLSLRRNPAADHATPALELFGADIELISLLLDDQTLPPSAWQLSAAGDRLTIAADVLMAGGEQPELTIITVFNPTANLALEGLYVTNGTFCTQCEAEGFRRISYFPDRPDVLSEYRVTIRAARAEYPVLLSNGNLVSQRDLDDGRHEAVWLDPHKKPCYLFALVAGKIDRLQEHFVTASGRTVLLEIYSTAANLPRCTWAMQCLKAAMRWDEEAYGREYDLDRFMIYAADDFNMGAMENKGLNVFNSRFLLADRDTATDADFQTVDAIVAHEYFHNWSGNRVTCRDWFQLSLKEGFTVFREQQYMATRASPAVIRIDETAFMQSRQFAQDAGPMAHAIRPDEYEAIDNFYTVTVYEKGAEVIRMLRTLLGAEAYRKGADLYFARHDGTAATCDDFIAAMEAAADRDLSQFKHWYSQAGTPQLLVQDDYDPAQSRYTLRVTQTVPATPGQPDKHPMVVPLAVGLLQEGAGVTEKRVLTVSERTQSFSFAGVPARPVPSLLRGFSAPVKVEFPYSDAQLAMLVTQDDDGVSRWQAVRALFFRAFDHCRSGGSALPALDHAVASLLADYQTDPALVACMLAFPSHRELADRDRQIDPAVIATTRDALLRQLASTHRAAIIERYGHERIKLAGRAWSQNVVDVAHRALAGTLLAFINIAVDAEGRALALAHWRGADNLTDVMSAMTALRDQPCDERNLMFSAFHDSWQHDLSMLNRWFALEAGAARRAGSSAEASVRALLNHERFDSKNPNRVRSVVQAFIDQNWEGLHAVDGSGYAFVAEQVLRFDGQNPSLAARFCDAFSIWYRCVEPYRTQQAAYLRKLAAHETLSPNVREVIEKTLKAGDVQGA